MAIVLIKQYLMRVGGHRAHWVGVLSVVLFHSFNINVVYKRCEWMLALELNVGEENQLQRSRSHPWLLLKGGWWLGEN